MNLDCLNENLLDKKADKEASRCRGGCVLMWDTDVWNEKKIKK
jgi:hypothetical protein